MGWASGSSLFADIAEVIADNVTDEDERRTVYDAMIASFMERDCDTLDECFDIDYVLDAALNEALDVDDEEEEE